MTALICLFRGHMWLSVPPAAPTVTYCQRCQKERQS